MNKSIFILIYALIGIMLYLFYVGTPFSTIYFLSYVIGWLPIMAFAFVMYLVGKAVGIIVGIVVMLVVGYFVVQYLIDSIRSKIKVP